jgi:hypothetical protein
MMPSFRAQFSTAARQFSHLLIVAALLAARQLGAVQYLW